MSETVPQQQSSSLAVGARAEPDGPDASRGDDPERRALADRISEDVLQLLYTARQDLAELSTQTPSADPELVRSAHDCTAGAISILRGVVATVLTAAWGPPADASDAAAEWNRSSVVLFDALSDAWVITCEHEDLLYASRAACEVLGHTSDEIARLMRDPEGWPRRLAHVPQAAPGTGPVAFVITVPADDGGVRRIDVVSHPLPAAPDLEPSFISLLKAQEG